MCEDYTYADETGKNCASDQCTETQILGIDGKCSECAEYSYPDETGKSCVADACDAST